MCLYRRKALRSLILYHRTRDVNQGSRMFSNLPRVYCTIKMCQNDYWTHQLFSKMNVFYKYKCFTVLVAICVFFQFCYGQNQLCIYCEIYSTSLSMIERYCTLYSVHCTEYHAPVNFSEWRVGLTEFRHAESKVDCIRLEKSTPPLPLLGRRKALLLNQY